LSARLPKTEEGRVIRYQITKAGTSIGAHYREADRSRSKANFKNKISICESEARVTQYWREIIIEVGWLMWEDLKEDYNECCELLALFTSIEKKR